MTLIEQVAEGIKARLGTSESVEVAGLEAYKAITGRFPSGEDDTDAAYLVVERAVGLVRGN